MPDSNEASSGGGVPEKCSQVKQAGSESIHPLVSVPGVAIEEEYGAWMMMKQVARQRQLKTGLKSKSKGGIVMFIQKKKKDERRCQDLTFYKKRMQVKFLGQKEVYTPKRKSKSNGAGKSRYCLIKIRRCRLMGTRSRRARGVRLMGRPGRMLRVTRLELIGRRKLMIMWPPLPTASNAMWTQ